MVRPCSAGGGLSSDLQARFDAAARTYAQGRFGAAAALYHEILDRSPHHPEALLMLGLIAQRANKSALALSLFDSALEARPDFSRAHFNRGVILRLVGRNADALQAARKATEYEPGLGEAWDLLGQILKDDGAYDESESCHKRAIALQPDNALFHGNYSMLLFARNDIYGAYLAAHRAEKLDADYPPILLGNILRRLGYAEQAAERFARCRALRPDMKSAAANEAMTRLQTGDMEQGLALWEQRPDLDGGVQALDLWQGQKIDSLFLYEDQGLGDALQFMRYIPLLRDRATHLVLRVREPLRALCAENFPDLILSDDVPPECLARCRLSSLPFFFNTRLNSIPGSPYLAASGERRGQWRSRLGMKTRPRIGLVWSGNPRFRHDAERSVDFSVLTPLLDCRNVDFISLQKERPGDADAVAAAGLFDAAAQITDFADTAALIAELDLVITVDTAVAHLAGALAKPVWIMLQFDSDWRWLLGREDSPWYHSARLFRQKRLGIWTGVVEDVAAEIQKFAGGNRAVLRAAPWQGPCLRRNPDALPLPL